MQGMQGRTKASEEVQQRRPLCRVPLTSRRGTQRKTGTAEEQLKRKKTTEFNVHNSQTNTKHM